MISDRASHQRKKRNSTMKRFLVPALLLLTCAVGTAQAGTQFLTQTLSAPAATVPTSDTFLFNQFNPSLGTLTDVEITVTSNIVADVLVLNSLTTAQGFTNAMASVPVSVTGPAGLSASVTATTPGQSSPPLPMVAAGATDALLGSAVVATASTTLNSPPTDLSAYVGTGLNDVAIFFAATGGTYTITAANGVFVSGSATADATVTLTYSYTSAIPEPSSVILAGIGMVGVAVFSRRRRAA
jgi:hypothetical protein